MLRGPLRKFVGFAVLAGILLSQLGTGLHVHTSTASHPQHDCLPKSLAHSHGHGNHQHSHHESHDDKLAGHGADTNSIPNGQSEDIVSDEVQTSVVELTIFLSIDEDLISEGASQFIYDLGLAKPFADLHVQRFLNCLIDEMDWMSTHPPNTVKLGFSQDAAHLRC